MVFASITFIYYFLPLFLIVYFVVRMLKLSNLPAVMPCNVNIAKNIVNTSPTLHLKKLEIKALNLSNLTLSVMFVIIENTKLSINNGTIK